ncbi:MAG: FG-GAP-like repeat-containing protein [Phycisphaerales bacterium]
MPQLSFRRGPGYVLPLCLIAGLAPSSAIAQSAAHAPARPLKASCPKAPVGRVAFTEEAAARGLNYRVAASSPPNGGYGSAAFVDLDSDGDPDIVAVGDSTGIVGIYENVGTGHFINHSKSSGITPMSKMGGICAADYDDDGDMDLFISRVLADDLLLRNDGGFTFTDVTAAAGVLGNLGAGDGCAWGDYNNDGWLDLLVGNRAGSLFPDLTMSTVLNRLYRNNGDGTFTDVAPAAGIVSNIQPTLTTAFVDYDLDGDADIYVGNDKGTQCIQYTNHLYRNNGDETFTDVTVASGTQSCTDTMSIAIGDFDANGYPDFFCTNTPPPPGHALMLNNGDGSFHRYGPEAGVTGNHLGWGSNFIDYDNDGVMGLYVVHSDYRNYFYEYTNPFPCIEIGQQLGIAHTGVSYNTSFADIDGDGDLDLVVQDISGPLLLYVNHDGERRSWIRFDVVGDPPNRNAVGAIVRVMAEGRWQMSEVLAGGNNYRSQNELTLHYGLNNACTAEAVHAEWPDGQSRMLSNYPAGSVWTLVPPSMLGDANDDGRIDAVDMQRMVSSFGPVAPGLEALDMNGDAKIDAVDLDLQLRRYVQRRY